MPEDYGSKKVKAIMCDLWIPNTQQLRCFVGMTERRGRLLRDDRYGCMTEKEGWKEKSKKEICRNESYGRPFRGKYYFFAAREPLKTIFPFFMPESRL